MASTVRERNVPGARASPVYCEVRLWGAHGTRGRQAAEIAREAEARKTAQAARPTDVAEFARSGPLYRKLLLSCPPPGDEEWTRLGAVLAEHLSVPQGLADSKAASRIYHLYLPIYFWMRQRLVDVRAARASRGETSHGAVVVGLSAPQGCGKSTLAESFQVLFEAEGMRYQAISYDDFYLPRSWHEAVADLHEGNSLLQTRGNAGTHEVGLGQRTLQALKSGGSGEVSLPCYNKSAYGGKGDRAPSASWSTTETPIDVVLVEGWMLGFKARADTDALAKIHSGLPLINEKLQQYQAWDDLMDAFCVVGIEDASQVFQWRLQAERAMRASGRSGMSDEELARFVENYLPAYEAYRPKLYSDADSREGVDGKPSLFFFVDSERRPLSVE